MSGADCNVRSSAYFVAAATTHCPFCANPTRVVALVVGPAHEVLDPDEESASAWQVAGTPAILSHLHPVGEALTQLKRVSPEYRRDVYGEWLNHCRHCGLALDEEALHEEPGGAFMPENSEQAREVTLKLIEQPLLVGAAGYQPEPEFFDLFRRL